MSRYIKERMVKQYAERFREVSDVAAFNTEGIDANQMVVLRFALRRRGLETMRVQNRLCRRAIQDGPLAGADTLLDGPTTLVWGADSIVDIAKALAEEAKALSALEIRGGFSAGAVLSREQIEDLSRLPGWAELIGQAVARALGQAARLVSLALAPASGLLAQIREIEKRGAQEAPAETPADEPPAPVEAEPAEEGANADEPPEEAEKPQEAETVEEPETPESREAERDRADEAEQEAGTADDASAGEAETAGQEDQETQRESDDT